MDSSLTKPAKEAIYLKNYNKNKLDRRKLKIYSDIIGTKILLKNKLKYEIDFIATKYKDAK